MITDKHREAMKMLQDLPRQDIVALSNEVHNQTLHEEEHGKAHALSAFRLPDDQWAGFKAHMEDGGGVIDDSKLLDKINRARLGDDQETFWHLLPHLVKARNNIHAKTIRHPGGGIQHNYPGEEKV